MMTRFAYFPSLILMLALALMGHVHAQALPPVSTPDTVAICSENGAEFVTADSQGNPVDHQACAGGICAECLHVAAHMPHDEAVPNLRAARPCCPAVALASLHADALGLGFAMPRAPPAQARA